MTCRNISSLFYLLFPVITFTYFLRKIFFFSLDIVLQTDAYIRICNSGAYLAKCYLQSRTLSYGFRTRHHDTGLFPVAQCATLDIPVDAFANRLECKTLAFIAIYKTIFVQEFASAMYNYCYKITGTTLNPHWSQTEC